MWTKDEFEEEVWRRSDGATVKRVSGGTLNPYLATDRTGCSLQNFYPGRKPVRRMFKTPEFAMTAADKHWPLRAEADA
jgi:hypothetical protein